MKKLLAILLASAMMASLAACGENSDPAESTPTGSSEKEPVTITFFGGVDNTGTIGERIELFEKQYDWITVDYQEFSGNSDDRKKTIINSLQAGDDELDVFLCDTIWVSQFAAAGWLTDVTEELNAVKDQHLAGPLSTCMYDNTAYAMPVYSDAGVLLYRSDIIETPPTTWDELVAMCKEHVGKDGIEYGYVFQAKQTEAIVCNMLEFIKQNGGNDVVDGEVVIDSDETREAFQFVLDMIDDGIAPEGVLTHIPDDTRVIFEGGKALFSRNWPYAYSTAQTEGGDSKIAGKVGIAPLPVGPKGEDSSATLGGWNMAASAYTDQPEASKLFLEFMSGEEAQKIMVLGDATFPTVASLYEDEEVLEKLPFMEELKPVLDAAKPRPQVSDYSAISTVMQVDMHTILTKEISVDEGVTKLAQDMKDIIAEMG